MWACHPSWMIAPQRCSHLDARKCCAAILGPKRPRWAIFQIVVMYDCVVSYKEALWGCSTATIDHIYSRLDRLMRWTVDWTEGVDRGRAKMTSFVKWIWTSPAVLLQLGRGHMSCFSLRCSVRRPRNKYLSGPIPPLLPLKSVSSFFTLPKHAWWQSPE